MNRLYGKEDDESLKVTAKDCLINFGTTFESEIITHAESVFVYTSKGHRILDWTSGQMSCLIGHGHKEVVQTITEHAANLDHLFSGMISPPVVRLAQKLTEVLPEGLDRAMFLSTGGESNEAAIKLAKTFTGKFEIVGLGMSWHGMTSTALGAQYQSGRKGHGPPVSGKHVQTPDLGTLMNPRCLVIICCPFRMPTALSSVIRMAATIGKPSSTMAGH